MKQMTQMRRLLIFLFLLLFLFPLVPVTASAKEEAPYRLPLQAAFVRDNHLWMKIGTQETQITKDGKASTPLWSHDGRFISYLLNDQLWVYNRTTRKQYQITLPDHHKQIRNAQWAPNKNLLAFQVSDGELLITDIQCGRPADLPRPAGIGVHQYAWLPDGTGFLASTSATPLPDGWTRPVLYKIPLAITGGRPAAVRFFELPSMVTKGNLEILSIGTTTFKWSPDGKWVAFVVMPTASWAADSDMLCVLSVDGKRFEPLDEMLANEQWFAWAPRKNALGYIVGNGRFALYNKRLKVQELPDWRSGVYTPARFVDIGLTWETENLLTVARAQETNEMSSSPEKRSKPVLYRLNLQEDSQQQISTPPAGFGDYNPCYVNRSQRLTWVRGNSKAASVWVANSDGTKAEEWIANLSSGSNYYEQWSWQDVLSIYGAKR